MHVIRAWEKRFGVVEPHRTETNRRLYSESDIHRLELLHQLTQNGYGIGAVAKRPLAELESILADSTVKTEQNKTVASLDSPIVPEVHLQQCLQAVRQFDAVGLEATLARASVELSQPVLIDAVIIPLIVEIGEAWRGGSLRITHEHFATTILRNFLTNQRKSYRPAVYAPRMIVTTPTGQVHELGAMLAALVAAAEGWRVLYLGADLPAEEITAACIQNEANACVLSLVYPVNDTGLFDELEKLRQLLPDVIKLIVGGRVSERHKSKLDLLGAWSGGNLSDFRDYLRALESRITI